MLPKWHFDRVDKVIWLQLPAMRAWKVVTKYYMEASIK